METRLLGKTGLEVSTLGLGCGGVGESHVTEEQAAQLLHGALDLGVTLLDTAPSYGASEERIGRHLRHRRSEFILSTKCGYGVPGVEDWTPECIRQGVERALERLRTDHLDLLHLHSCPPEVLERPGIVEAVESAVKAGKVRVAAYSGENEALAWAIRSHRFGVVQRSVNLCEPAAARDLAPAKAGVGVIAKRSLANAVWRFASAPERPDLLEYWSRLRRLELAPPSAMGWAELALRSAAFTPGVSSCLVGTQSLDHLRTLQGYLDQGPLPEEVLQPLRFAWDARANGWPGLI